MNSTNTQGGGALRAGRRAWEKTKAAAAAAVAAAVAPLLALALLATSSVAAAQTVPNAQQYLDATGADDGSVMIFKQLAGDFFTSPLSYAGGAQSLMGTMFVIFNGFVFAIAMLWMTYGIIFKIVSTAGSGDVMGRDLSAAWTPVRYLAGVAGIVPIFGGFSLSQVLLVVVAALGIGVTNMATNKAMEATAQFQGLVSPSLAAGHANVALSDATRALFRAHVCRLAIQREQQESANAGVPPPSTQVVREFGVTNRTGDGADIVGLSIGTDENQTMCGKVAIKVAARSESSATSFRVASVDYAAIARAAAEPVRAAYQNGFGSYAEQVKAAAEQWFQRLMQARQQDGVPQPVVDLASLDAITESYAAAVRQAAANASLTLKGNEGAITNAALAEMKQMGWVGLGSWYSTFAEVNAALSDALNGVEVSTAPFDSISDGEVIWALNSLKQSEGEAEKIVYNRSTDGGSSGESAGWVTKLCRMVVGTNETGNCSLGQAIAKKGMSAAAEDSGGAGLINPIIMFKNMGDYLMWVGQVIIGFFSLPLMDTVGKVLGGIAGWFSGAGAGTAAAGPAGTVGGSGMGAIIGASAMAMMPTLGALAFLLGALMALYIPFIPFITWMGGLIQYAVVVVEGLVGMPIAALSHMDHQGEGLGQRTERGYIFLLNVAFRPILMAFGFFAASALVIAIGTLQFKLFAPAMAGVQGNSVTGFASIIGLLVIFFVMNVTLIQGLFNMIFLLPDQVLGLIGGHGTDPIGKETEDKAHALFMSTARFGQQNAKGAVIASAAAKRQSTAPGQSGDSKSSGKS